MAVKFNELFRGTADGKTSSTYFWFNIANAAATIAYILISWAVFKSAQPNIDAFAMYTAVYMGIVAGNKVASKYLSYKFNKTEPEEPEEPKK